MLGLALLLVGVAGLLGLRDARLAHATARPEAENRSPPPAIERRGSRPRRSASPDAMSARSPGAASFSHPCRRPASRRLLRRQAECRRRLSGRRPAPRVPRRAQRWGHRHRALPAARYGSVKRGNPWCRRNYELHEPGYVRHFHETDDGESLPAILMFHPDFEWLDENGDALIALPSRRSHRPARARPFPACRSVMLDLPASQGAPDVP